MLSPPALERRASKVPGSREALLLSPLHEYSHLVIGANNPDLPPPFSPAAFRRYVRWAWLCEGGAVWLSGQTPVPARGDRAPPARGRPARSSRPSARDAMLLGGTIFSMLEREGGPGAAAALATSPLEDRGARGVLAEAFERPLAAVERDWRAELDSLIRCPEPAPRRAAGRRRATVARAPLVLAVEQRLVGARDQHRRRVALAPLGDARRRRRGPLRSRGRRACPDLARGRGSRLRRAASSSASSAMIANSSPP